MIVRTDAVVLRAFDYGETSRIVTLFTRQHGVLGTLAKGSRRPTSRFGATLQPTAYVQVVYYYKAERGLQTLREATHLQRFPRLATPDADPEALPRITAGLRIVELVRALLEERDANPPLFGLLVQTLAWLDAAPAHAANALPWFQLRLAAHLGFTPDVQREDVEAVGEDGGTLLLDTGTIAPAGFVGRASVRASRPALRAFAVFARTDLATAGRLRLDADQRTEIEALVDAYLRYHTEDVYPDRVRRVAGQMAEELNPRR